MDCGVYDSPVRCLRRFAPVHGLGRVSDAVNISSSGAASLYAPVFINVGIVFPLINFFCQVRLVFGLRFGISPR